uniref:fimbrial protein n=1 Tax=Castellaniella defragrans TaxID=75697 RepID=UPI003341AF09
MPGIALARRLVAVSLLLALSMLSAQGHAACTVNNTFVDSGDGSAAKIAFGRVNLESTYLQPVGSLLATTVVPPTQYTHGGTTAASVLWTCSRGDLPNVYFLVATNGDDRLGGYYETGASDGLSGVYATWFEHVGLKLSMSGVTLSRHWQRIPVGTYGESGTQVQIRLQDVPVMQAELYRISNLPPSSGASSDWCDFWSIPMGRASTNGTAYACNQPSAYIQLVGPGLAHDEIGEDSATHYDFYGLVGGGNGFGYTLYQAASLSSTNSCVARSATPHVLFQTISAQELRNGGSTQANFSVEVECSNSVFSGIGSGQTALGIQVSPGAYSAAQGLGLVNTTTHGVSMLVSDNYGNDSSLAQGVGISLKNASTGADMVFVGQPGITGSLPSPNPSGQSAGWYPVLDGAQNMGSTQSGYTHYLRTFTATLQQLPSRTATPGKVYATAYVLVKVQ